MNMKPVELQIAIPRAQDLAKQQEQMNQKVINDQVDRSVAQNKKTQTEMSKTAKSKGALLHSANAQTKDIRKPTGWYQTFQLIPSC